MPELEYEIELLSRLIDGAAACARTVRAEADQAREECARALLSECSEMHDDIALELQTRVRELGGEPVFNEDGGRGVAGAGEPGAAVSSASRSAPIDPDRLIRELDHAVLDARLSASTRQVLRACLDILRNERLEPRRQQPDR